MLKNTLKKITGIALTVGMILSMGVTAFADTPAADYGTQTILNLPKDVMIYNNSGHKIDAPEISYSYSVVPVTPAENTSIKDYQGNTGTVRAGIAGVVSISESLDFSAEAAKEATVGHIYAADNEKYTKNILVNIDIANIPAAGIYRYKITDTTPADALAKAGIIRSAAYDPIRYLDIYVSNGANGLYISGTILFKSGADSTSFDGTDGTNLALKVTGFDSTSEAFADQYHTYNLDITKKVEGAMGDKTHDFPFAVATAAASDSKIFFQVDNTEEQESSIGTEIATTLHDGQTLHIYGLPQTTVYNVAENNNTYDTYTVSIFDDNDPVNFYNGFGIDKEDGSKGKEVARNNQAAAADAAGIALVEGYTASEAGTQAMGSLTFLNYLNAISPTGVALRVAPYAIMLAAGLFLLVFGKKFRTEAE